MLFLWAFTFFHRRYSPYFYHPSFYFTSLLFAFSDNSLNLRFFISQTSYEDIGKI